MDYSSIFKDYFMGLGNCTQVRVSQLTDYSYEAEIYYGDEEIENYLGAGSTIILTLNAISEEGENQIFHVNLEGITIPEVNKTEIDESNATMTLSLLEEVARAAHRFITSAQVDDELWININGQIV